MDKLAQYLIENETITGKEFMRIFREVEGIPEPEEEEEGEAKEKKMPRRRIRTKREESAMVGEDVPVRTGGEAYQPDTTSWKRHVRRPESNKHLFGEGEQTPQVQVVTPPMQPQPAPEQTAAPASFEAEVRDDKVSVNTHYDMEIKPEPVKEPAPASAPVPELVEGTAAQTTAVEPSIAPPPVIYADMKHTPPVTSTGSATEAAPAPAPVASTSAATEAHSMIPADTAPHPIVAVDTAPHPIVPADTAPHPIVAVQPAQPAPPKPAAPPAEGLRPWSDDIAPMPAPAVAPVAEPVAAEPAPAVEPIPAPILEPISAPAVEPIPAPIPEPVEGIAAEPAPDPVDPVAEAEAEVEALRRELEIAKRYAKALDALGDTPTEPQAEPEAEPVASASAAPEPEPVAEVAPEPEPEPVEEETPPPPMTAMDRLRAMVEERIGTGDTPDDRQGTP